MRKSVHAREIPVRLLDGAGEESPVRKHFGARTDVGGRRRNEDRYYGDDETQTYIVADGMGGYDGGALASQIVVETVPDELNRVGVRYDCRPEDFERTFSDAIIQSSAEMASVAREHAAYKRMGCTMAASFVLGSRLYFSSVGDCRVYLFRRRKLKQITRDESVVQELMDAGLLTAAEARNHRWRHLVTNSVNARGIQRIPVLNSIKLRRDDVVLLTSDGLTNTLSRREMESCLRSYDDPQQCADVLIQRALDENANDNLTCVVHRVS